MSKPEKQKKGRKPIGLLIVAALLIAFFLWPRGHGKKDQLPLLSEVTRGKIENAVTATGTIEPETWVDVGVQVSGQLRSLAVDVGDAVEEGQFLAEIDASVQINRVEASRASLEAERAQEPARLAAVKLARSNLERQKELFAKDLTSRSSLDDAITQLVSAESSRAELDSRIESWTASLASDEAQLAYSKIYAPLTGTVVSVLITEGQTLNAVQHVPTLLRISDLTTMEVRADVSEADVGQLRVGMPAYFSTLGSGERRWKGTISQILPTPNVVNNVVFYPVLFTVSNDDRSLLPQMTAQVFFVVDSAHEVLRVPVGALKYSGGVTDKATVQVMNDEGGVESREVQLGITDRIFREVISGLKAGDWVIAGVQDTKKKSKGGK